MKACLAQLEKLTGESGRLHALETKSARKAQVDLIAVSLDPTPGRFGLRRFSEGAEQWFVRWGLAVAASRGRGGV